MAGAVDNDPIAAILQELDVEALRRRTIKHTFHYRSVAGRLQGYREDQLQQRFEGSVVHGVADEQQAIIEVVLAAAMERYDAFGPFHQYPRTYVLGPSQFDARTGLLRVPTGTLPSDAARRAASGMPHVRDVDRLVWMKVPQFPLRSPGYQLAWVDMFHDDYTGGVDVVRARYTSVTDGTAELGGVRPERAQQLVEQDVRQIIDGVFADGSVHCIAWTRAGRSRQLATDTDPAYLALLWMAQTLGHTRRCSVQQLIDGAKGASVAHLILGSALIGHLGFTVPHEVAQSDHPVPIGAVTAAKLAAVLRDVVMVPAADGSGRTTTTASLYTDAMAQARRTLASTRAAADPAPYDCIDQMQDGNDNSAWQWPSLSSDEEDDDDDDVPDVYAGYAADTGVLRSSSSDDDDDDNSNNPTAARSR